MELYWYTSGKRRKVLETGSELGRGREGTVFEVLAEPGTVVKVFKVDSTLSAEEEEREAEERARKLELFVRHRPPNPPDRHDGHRKFAWPERVLFNGAGLCVGYAMPRACGKPLDTFIYPKDGVLAELKLRVAIAREVASIVAEVHLHQLSMRLGDISPANFLADAKGRVTLIDIDSAEIRSPDDGEIYRCPTRTSEYTAPELIGRDLSTEFRTEEQDLFGLSVLEHRSLFEGWHPYAACDADPIEKHIVDGVCPLIQGGDRDHPVPPEAPPFGGGPDFDVGDELRELLERAFVAGQAEPRLRPRAVEWDRPLRCYEKRLGRPLPRVAGRVPQVTLPAPGPWRRTVVAFSGAAAIAASVGFFCVGQPSIGEADEKASVRLWSVTDRADLKGSVVEPRHELVPDADEAALSSGPEQGKETPFYVQRLRDGGYEPLSFEIPSDIPWEIER